MLKIEYTVFTSTPEKQQRWREIVAEMYQPQATKLIDPRRFYGRITKWHLGQVELSLYESGPAALSRARHHLRLELADQFFVVMPRSAPMSLLIRSATVNCAPGQFIIQDGCSVSGWQHDNVTAIAVRVSGDSLRQRITVPNELCGLSSSCGESTGALFAAFVQTLVNNADGIPQYRAYALGEQIVDLLAMALDSSDRQAAQTDSLARAAHRNRAMSYIETHFHDPDLRPEHIASACGISLRYLHQLFSTTDWTVVEWMIERRLLAAWNLLRSRSSTFKTITGIAYECGFNDASNFSRRFKARFNLSPGGARRTYTLEGQEPQSRTR